jgi:DNA-binding LacI/PurR family transcriptional regulator
MITLQDIAKRLNVSTATVSNALTGKGRMRKEKRQEILETAAAFGYDTQSVQQRQRTRSVYVIVEQLCTDFLNNVINHVCARADEMGAKVYLCNLNMISALNSIFPDNERLKMLVRPCFQQIGCTANGIIYISQYPRDLTGAIPKTPIPLVIAYGYTTDAVPCINYDDSQGAYTATEHLIRCGRKRIAMISGPINSIPMTKRLAGYQRALIDGGLSFDPKLIQLGDWLMRSGYNCAKALMSEAHSIDAFFCQSDDMAVGAIKAVKELGLKVPQDVSIIGFDNSTYLELVEPTLTTIAPPYADIGTLAFDTLYGLMNGHKPASNNVKLKCALIRRESA